VKRLGKGASGEVYQANYLGKEVAVKVLSSMDTEEELIEFQSEFQILIQLNSPFVIKFLGATLTPYMSMVMEFCDNGSLYSYLRRNTDIPWLVILRFMNDIASGLNYLHTLEQPIVHRDIKSLNILVDTKLTAKLCDFGLSRLWDTRKSTFHKIVGTEVYIAPEILREIPTTVKSDIYSMGIVLWELISTGVNQAHALPFSEYGHTLPQIILVRAMDGLRPSLPHRSPPVLSKLYLACVNGDPEERPTAQEVLSIIEELLHSYDPTEWDTYRSSYQLPSLLSSIRIPPPTVNHYSSEDSDESNF